MGPARRHGRRGAREGRRGGDRGARASRAPRGRPPGDGRRPLLQPGAGHHGRRGLAARGTGRGMTGFTGRLLAVIRRLRPEIRRHRRFLLIGTAGSLVVVACRLAYALPLKGVLDTASGAHTNGFVFRLLVLFLVIASLQGIGEYFQRVWFARFALAVSRDVRVRARRARGPARGPPRRDADAGARRPPRKEGARRGRLARGRRHVALQVG